MTDSNPQVPWTEEQWARANRVIQEEAQPRARGGDIPAAYRSAPAGRRLRQGRGDQGRIRDGRRDRSGKSRITIEDTTTIKLATLQVKVFLRGAQMADPDMKSALQLFRRAANVLAPKEDAVVFQRSTGPDTGPDAATPDVPAVCEILGGEPRSGLFDRKSRHAA